MPVNSQTLLYKISTFCMRYLEKHFTSTSNYVSLRTSADLCNNTVLHNDRVMSKIFSGSLPRHGSHIQDNDILISCFSREFSIVLITEAVSRFSRENRTAPYIHSSWNMIFMTSTRTNKEWTWVH